jgi:outer membrane protein assembly factor BamC
MNRFKLSKIAILSLLIFGLSACDSIPFFDNTPDYKSAGRARPLEVPPDLTSVSASDTFAVPSTTYSQFNQDGSPLEQEKILPNPDNVKLERAGSQRWLVVQAPPEKIWPVIREFWTELGFSVRVENPETGVMETEWVDPSNLTKDEKGNYLDKFQGWLDKLNAMNTRQKFRTRIDRGDAGATEIYLSHRSLADAPDNGREKVRTRSGEIDNGYSLKSNKLSKAEQERSDAEDIDAELMRRLMVRLGVEDKKSRSVIATASNEQRATINKSTDGFITLTANDPFDRAWRRVGLALDRIGFVVEDRNRSKGLYYVRYTDLGNENAPKDEKGLLDKLKFWGDDEPEVKKPKTEETTKVQEKGLTDKLQFWKVDESINAKPEIEYRVKVEDQESGGSLISVTDKEGNREKSNTANNILNMLYEQLK